MAERSLYYVKIEPNLRLIKEWLSEGVCYAQICEDLDIAKTCWYDYISKYPDLAKIVEETNNHRKSEEELKNNIDRIKNATFTLTVIVQNDPEELDEEDNWVLVIRKYDTIWNRNKVD